MCSFASVQIKAATTRTVLQMLTDIVAQASLLCFWGALVVGCSALTWMESDQQAAVGCEYVTVSVEARSLEEIDDQVPTLKRKDLHSLLLIGCSARVSFTCCSAACTLLLVVID